MPELTPEDLAYGRALGLSEDEPLPNSLGYQGARSIGRRNSSGTKTPVPGQRVQHTAKTPKSEPVDTEAPET